MRRRTLMAAALLATVGFFYTYARGGTLIGLQELGSGGFATGEFNLVTVDTSTGQATVLAPETGFVSPTGNYSYDNLNNTYSFTYDTAVTGGTPIRLRTIDATSGLTVSDVQLSSSSFPAYNELTALAPNLGNFTTLSTTGLATLNSASVTNDLSVGGALNVTGLSTLSGGVQTTTVNAATSVTTPLITATTGNIEKVNDGADFNA